MKSLSNFPLCLAPMVGLTHVSLREVVRSYMPEKAYTIWPTEMLNSRRIPSEILEETPEAYRSPEEDRLVPQILGNERRPIEESVQKLKEWGAVAIDINMGCPVKKALQHNYGVSLMGDMNYAAEIVQFAAQASSLPVSVKLRSGEKEDLSFLTDFMQALESSGARWLTLHPRLTGQKRRGEANWSTIGSVKGRLRIPVIGNGDIQTAEDVFRMKSETGCDLVMSGRALAARPWLMWQVGEALGFAPPREKEGMAPRGPYEEGREYGKVLRQLSLNLSKRFDLNGGLRRIKFWARMTSPWLEYGHFLLKELSSSHTWDDVLEAEKRFFAQPQKMYPRTELRL